MLLPPKPHNRLRPAAVLTGQNEGIVPLERQPGAVEERGTRRCSGATGYWRAMSGGATADFRQYACTHLSTARADGGPVQCLVDERAWVSDTTFLPNLDRDAAIDRVRAGLDHGDGAVVTWLTLEMEDMIDQPGRWAVRDPYIETHPYTAYLPRLSRNMVGEALLWEVNPDLSTYPECAGEWNLGAENCRDSVDQPGAGSYTIDLEEGLYSGLRFGWEIKNDETPATLPGETSDIGRADVGDSQRLPQMFRFALVPPPGCPDPDPTDVEQVAIWNDNLYSLYDGITCILQGVDPALCGGTP